jgi:alkylhydroperoxidase family enzyme
MSTCIPPVQPDEIPPESAEILEALGERFPGSAMGLLLTAAHSPVVLHAVIYQAATEAMCKLAPRLRDGVALRAAELLGCSYNIARYTAAALDTGLDVETIADLRRGSSSGNKEQALLALTSKLVRDRGRHTRLVFDVARQLGITHAEILEVITIVASVTFTSYLAGVACIEPEACLGRQVEPKNAMKTVA